MKRSILLLAGLCLLLASEPVVAQKEREKKDATEKEVAKEGEKEKKKKAKTYKDIITEEAVTDSGLFIVHKVADKYYWELPKALLGKEILVVSRISGHVKGLNFGGAGMKSRPQQVVRFQLHDNKVLMRSVSYTAVADSTKPIYQSVRNNNFEPVIMTFKLACFNEDSSAIVFEPAALFTTNVPMLGALNEATTKRFGIKGLDTKRSFIQWMHAYPQNVEVRHVLTYRGGEKLPAHRTTGTLSVEMNQSFILLPEEPMQPRLYDSRVGYFSIQQFDYGLDEQKAAKRRYITRWRLVPKDVEAYKRGELVEPVKPIVYYIDPATPEEWRPYIKQGVEDWQAAFEKAGFKNAIIAKDPPSPEEDPEWSPEDVRYSVIRYVATDIQNAMGPHVHDPRTGEILESDIIWYHNVMNLLRNWFFIQTAAVNPDARKVKFDKEVMGQLIRFVAAHEVGHTLGLPHNMGASPAYPIDSLRAPGFVQRMGVAPSIMDYARFNYVAQPEDEGAGLMPKIGPYDEWAIIYGYRYFPDVDEVEEEKKLLHAMILERADNPIYRYGQQQGRVVDPSAQTEDIGDDAIEASLLGIANLKRIREHLIEWTATPGKDYADLSELYRNLIVQFRRYIGHVANNVGGIYEYDKTADQQGPVYVHVPREKQERAVAFINEQVFRTPTWLIDKDIQARIGATGVMDQVRGLQLYALGTLFRADRLKRMMENEALNGSEAYTAHALFEDTRKAVFRGLAQGHALDGYARNLQRAYVHQMGELLRRKGTDYDLTDIKALAWATLQRIHSDIRRYAKKHRDELTRAHLLELADRIEAIQQGRAWPQASTPSSRSRAFEADPVLKGCWQE